MAKIRGPLFSNSATGSVAQAITMQRQNGRQLSKAWSKPTGSKSPKQTARRVRFLEIAAAWAALNPAQRAPYVAAAALLKITAWNAYLSESLKNNPPGLGILWDNGAAVWDNAAAVWS